MVVDEVDIHGLAFLKAEGDAPVVRHADAPVSGQIAYQWIQPPGGIVQFAGPGGRRRRRQDIQQLPCHRLFDVLGRVLGGELALCLVLESHVETVSSFDADVTVQVGNQTQIALLYDL